MASGRLFCLLGFVFVAVVEQFVSAASVCEAEPVKDPLVEGRANQIRFPDGRLITIVGHTHGRRQLQQFAHHPDIASRLSSSQLEALMRASLDENQKRENSDIESALLPAMAENFGLDLADVSHLRVKKAPFVGNSVLEDAHADFRYLHTRLSNAADRPQFVGLEAEGNHWQFAMKQGYDIAKRQISRHRQRLNLSNQEIDDFLVSASMGHFYAYLKKPSLRQMAPLVPIEGSEAHIDGNLGFSLQNANLPDLYKKHIMSLPPEHQAAAKQELVRYLWVLTNAFIESDHRFPDREPRELAADLLAVTPNWSGEAGKDLAKTISLSGESIRKRDRQSAKNLVDQRKTGLYFVGRLHLIPQSRGVQDLCKAELAADSRTPRLFPIPGSAGVR